MQNQPLFTVLCVDDNADQLLSLSMILRAEGYRVLEARTGTEALGLANQADLIVLDVGLPDLSGFEVCRQIKANETSLISVILLSGQFTRSEHRSEGLEGGADVYLTKPVEPRELLGQVKALLRIRQAELRAREAARQAEEGRRRLRAVTDHAPVLIAQVDTQARYVFVNRPYAARLGLTPEGIIGRRIPDVLGEAAYHAIAPHVEAALAGKRVEFEVEVPYASLGPQHMHAAYEPEFDEAGQVHGFIAAITNVTERVRAEAALRLRDRALRAVASGVLITDPVQLDNPIIYASPGFGRLTGYSHTEVVGKNPRLLQGGGTDPRAVAQVRAAVAEGRECLVELLNYKKDGTPFWNQMLISPVRDEQGRLTHFVGVQTDVTPRKKAEEQVRVWRDRYEAAVRASGHLLYDWNATTDELTFGSNVEAVLGYAAAELRGGLDGWLELVHPEDRPAFLAEIGRVKRTGEPFRLEYRVRHKDGRPLHVRDDGHFVGGGTTQMVGFIVDTTERRRLEEQVRQAQRMEAVGQLAGGLAHDLNNLMTVVNGFTDIVMADLSEDDPQRVRVQEIKRAGERAAILTGQLLAFSQRQILHMKVLDLNSLLREMEKPLRRVGGGAMSVVLRLEPRLGRVKADPEQIRQAILSLAANAAEAMPDGGTLTVETWNTEIGEDQLRVYAEVLPGPYVLLSVSDTGSGMPEEVKARVFEPFFTTKPEGEGSQGLGLAAVYGIVKQSGGHIEVQSEAGAGSIFNVYLPRLAE